jgi:hypothetical protein
MEAFGIISKLSHYNIFTPGIISGGLALFIRN